MKTKKKPLGVKKVDELINRLDFAPVLKDQVRQVRWLYRNSNKCTMVYDEKLVRIMIHKLQDRITFLEFLNQYGLTEQEYYESTNAHIETMKMAMSR